MTRHIAFIALMLSAFAAQASTLNDYLYIKAPDGTYSRSGPEFYTSGSMTSDGLKSYPTKTADASKVTLGRTVSANLPTSRVIPVQFSDQVQIPRAKIGATVGRLVRGGLIYGPALGAITDMLTAAGHTWIAEQQQWVHTTPVIDHYNMANLGHHSCMPLHGTSPESCEGWIRSLYGGHHATCYEPPHNYAGMCYNYSYAYSTEGQYNGGSSYYAVNSAQGQQTPDSEADISSVYTSSTDLTKAAAVVSQIANAGYGIDATGTEVASITPSAPSAYSSTITKTRTYKDAQGVEHTEVTTTRLKATPTVTGSTTQGQKIKWDITEEVTKTIDGQPQESSTENVPDPDVESPPSEPEECGPGMPTCSPGELVQPELDSGLQTFQQITQSFKDRVTASPIAQSLTGLSAAIPTGGTCPTFNMATTYRGQVFGGVIDAHCPILATHYALIHALALLGISLSCIILFFKA